MRRKIVLHGPSTLTVSLPSGWAKKFDLKKGDELNIEERGSELRISIGAGEKLRKREMNVGEFKRVGKSKITSAYRQGYDSITLNYKDNSYVKTIQDLIAKDLIGFEVVHQTKDSCRVEDLAGHTKDEFDTALRRVWLLVQALASEGIESMRDKKDENLKGLIEIDNSINKFCNYCMRLLVKLGHGEHRKISLYYHLIRELEEIADKYKEIYNRYLEVRPKDSKNLVLCLAEVNSCLEEIYKIYYKYDEGKIEALFEKTKRIYSRKEGKTYDEQVGEIAKGIRGLLSVVVELNI